jgi:hypothetical protein
MKSTRNSLLALAAIALAIVPSLAAAQDGSGSSGNDPDIFTKKPGQITTPTPDGGANFTSPGGHGRSIAVFDPVGVGVDNDACQAVGDLLRSELQKIGRSVTPRSSMPAASCADEACATTAARTLADEAVVTKLSRLNQKVMVITTLVDTQTGRVTFSDRAAAASLDDMDALTIRMARSLTEHRAIADTMTPGTMTDYDAQEQKRQKSLFTTGLRIGGVVPIADSYAGASTLYDIDLVSYYEVRQYAIEAAIGYRGNTNDPTRRVGDGGIDLGGYYHLMDADISPFVGAGVGLHAVAAHYDAGFDKVTGEQITKNEGGTGPSIWVGGGVNILRAADVHIMAVAKYEITFVDIQNKPSNGVMAGIGITYARKGGAGCCLW